MDPKEEVHSDDGSFELVDFDDNVGLSDEDSYDLLSSDMSDTPEEEEEEDSNNTTVHEDNISAQLKSSPPDPPNDDPGSIDSYKSDSSKSESESEQEEEEELEEEEEEEEEEEQLSYSNDKGKKRNFMTMAYDYSNFHPYEYPSHVKITENLTIKQLARDQILRYLPAKSLARCRVVSKEWNSWISTPFFTHIQTQSFSQTSGFFQSQEYGPNRFISLDHFSYGVPDYPCLKFLPKETSIKSSCHGLLLCQAINDESEYYVCNPATKQFIEIPNSNYYHGETPKLVLAFEPSSLNFEPFYQIICPFFVPGEGPILYFDIYNSNTKSWRVSDEICVDFDAYDDLKKDGVFVNGVAYWEMPRGKLLAFDLKNEIYSVQKLPKDGALLKVNGEVCYVKGHYRHSTRMCELKVYDGGLMSLKNTMSFGVCFHDVEDYEGAECKVLGNPCDDVIGVVLKKGVGENHLFVYRLKDGEVEGPLFLQGCDTLFPYVNSLISIA